MKPLRLRLLVPATVLVVALLAVLSWRGHATARPQAAPQVQQWEYKFMYTSFGVEHEFNALGAEGWDLCAATGYENVNGARYAFVFKRPKR
jgi:hypothetical protein